MGTVIQYTQLSNDDRHQCWDRHLCRCWHRLAMGQGELTLLDGSQHQFKISGLDVVAVGIKQATGVGNVYNLKKLEDFAGKYVKVTAGAVVGGGAGATSMRNDKGVVINLTGVGQGIDFRLAVSGMDVTLVK